MRASVILSAVAVILLAPLLLACGRKPTVSLPTPTPVVTPTPVSAPRNLLMGTGEPRLPEPFTIAQRLLDAVSRGDRKTIERALEHGATVHAKDDIGRSTVLLAVLDAADLELVRWLHAKGALLDEPDNGGRTALSFAAERGLIEIVRYLVENGAAIERGDMLQRTPLFHAALANQFEVVSFLASRGGNVNARDQFGDTPLIVACAKGYGDLASLLLQLGADPTLKDQEGRTARDRAAVQTKACAALEPLR